MQSNLEKDSVGKTALWGAMFIVSMISKLSFEISGFHNIIVRNIL